ncbi:MAG TPA: hypothetical protein VMT57_04360 [Candidatus Thermoplasmatota archaeon]|nr:hypothetical protein [Candidatus Thermoplasmatota archaeon]
MMTKNIVAIVIIVSLFTTGVVFFTFQKTDLPATPENHTLPESSNETTNYTDDLEFDQQTLDLQKEVVQYEIDFHQNDWVDVSVYMYVSYVDNVITSNYFLLTNGEQPLMAPRILAYVPERKYLLVTPRTQISLGKFWLIKMLNDREGRIRIGSSYNDSNGFGVHAGDVWYLTLAVPTSSEQSGFHVAFVSTQCSMTVRQVVRHHDLGLFTATYNQFSGKYYAIKFSFLGGCSVGNITKEITTRNGSIVDFCVAAHRKGSLVAIQPNGAVILNNNKGFMHYEFLGNATGEWTFNFKGWSVYYRISAVLLYIDIDPHCFFSINEP